MQDQLGRSRQAVSAPTPKALTHGCEQGRPGRLTHTRTAVLTPPPRAQARTHTDHTEKYI